MQLTDVDAGQVTLDDADSLDGVLSDLRMLWDYLAVSAAPRGADVLFCFGSLNLGVPCRAAELFARGLAPWVLVTGGTLGRREPYATEADGYADVLRRSGVPKERIIVERCASNTGENVAFGMRALTERGIEVGSAALVAWPTSLRRCVATFVRWFPGVRTCPQPAFDGFGPYEANPARAVETALAELARLRTYPRLGHIGPQPITEAVTWAAARLTAFSSSPASIA